MSLIWRVPELEPEEDVALALEAVVVADACRTASSLMSTKFRTTGIFGYAKDWVKREAAATAVKKKDEGMLLSTTIDYVNTKVCTRMQTIGNGQQVTR